MSNTADGSRRLSVDSIERALAVLLLGLLGTFAVGQIGGDISPVVDGAGVVAVHLAVLVAGLFPLVVLVDAGHSRMRATTGPSRIEIGAAAVALGSLGAALWILLDASSALSTALFAVAVSALLVLSGLVVRQP